MCEAMFHQVRVDPNAVGSLRFLWFPAGDIDAEPEEFQMLVHLLVKYDLPAVLHMLQWTTQTSFTAISLKQCYEIST